jgi:hypothetical protein
MSLSYGTKFKLTYLFALLFIIAVYSSEQAVQTTEYDKKKCK